ncbi:MAG: metallophosphoesterase [Tenericutes bacterium]|nr:metallophosphoesterase [Mycoplasmatota bacterium]
MIAITLAPVYILVNYYVVRWLIRWVECCSEIFKKRLVRYLIVGIYIFFASSFIVGFFLPFRSIKIVGNYWLGVVQYILLFVIWFDLIRIILLKWKLINEKIIHARKTFILVGILCFLVVGAFSTYGVIHAKKIVVNSYQVQIDKKVDKFSNLKVALVSDLHFGYNSSLSHVKKMVKLINESDPDVVVIAGDIFDNSYEAIYEPDKIIQEIKKIKTKYGVYAVYGNHDIDEKILAGFTFSWKKNKNLNDPRMTSFLEKANIKLLRDESLLIDDSFYLVGRIDYHKYGMEVEKRKTIEELVSSFDKSKPIILIDHEPYELEKIAKAGVDLDLSGHTHNGQMFPSNVFIKFIWKNPHGLLKVDNMYSAVTSGVGVYGPNMRVGTTAEVMVLDLSFKK